METISAIILTKNSGNILEDCLKSLSFCSEIILVDDNSTDQTLRIAKNYKAKIIQNKEENFAKRRELGLKHATSEWIVYVDSDERISDLLRKNIQYQISNIKYPTKLVAFKLKRKNFYLGSYAWPKIEELERLFKRDKLKGWYGVLHESPKVEGEVGVLDGYLLHYTHRNLSEMLAKTIKWSTYEAQARFQAGHPKITWWRFFRVIISGFWDSYISQGGWRVGIAGFVESIYQGFSLFITYAKLWELQQKKAISKT